MNLEENNSNDNGSLDQDSEFTNLDTVDFLKGFAVFFIVLFTVANGWLSHDWAFLYGFLYLSLDSFGATLLIFLSPISVIFAMEKRMGLIPDKSIRNTIIARGAALIALGIGLNFFFNVNMPFPSNLWGWNLLTIMGFGQIVVYFSVKVERGLRVVLGLIIIFFTPQIREFLYIGKNLNEFINILHFFIISPDPHYPLIPYLALCLFSSVFGELLLEAMLLENKEAYIDVFRSFFKYGLVFILLGIYFGYELVTTEIFDPKDYTSMELIPILQDQSYFEVPSGLPGFLVRGTSANMFYSLGVALMTFGTAFYLLDVKHVEEKINNQIINFMRFFGKVSISLYLIHFVGLFLFFQSLNIVTFWPLFFAYFGFLGLILFVWRKYFSGFGTFEWLMAKIGFIDKEI